MCHQVVPSNNVGFANENKGVQIQTGGKKKDPKTWKPNNDDFVGFFWILFYENL